MSLLSSHHSAFTPLARAPMALRSIPDYSRSKDSSSPELDVLSKSCSISSHRSLFSSPSTSPNFLGHNQDHLHDSRQHQDRVSVDRTVHVDNDNSCQSSCPSDIHSEASHSPRSSPRSPMSPLSPGVEAATVGAEKPHTCPVTSRAFSFSVEDILKPDKRKSSPLAASAAVRSSSPSTSPAPAPHDLRWSALSTQPQPAHLHHHSTIPIQPQIVPTSAPTTTPSSAPALTPPTGPPLSSWFLSSRFPQNNSKSKFHLI